MSAISEDDAPTSDNPSEKAAGTSSHVAPTTQEPDDDAEYDTHCCGKCRLVFTSLDAYIQHKLSKDNCKVTYTKGNRWLIPRIVVKKEKRAVPVGARKGDNAWDSEESSKASARKKERRQSRVQLAHSQDNIIVKSEYTCKTCSKVFHREAILRRHVYYTHNNNFDSLNDDDEVANAKEELQPPTDGTTAGGSSGDEPARRSGRDMMEKENGVVSDDGDADCYTRSHTCMHCNRRFKEHNILRAHMLTHSNQRDYPCTWGNCQYAFKTKGSLKRHMRRHTGERPYRCELCGRCFGESGALTRHLKSRVPCTEKTDADLPRYGKKAELDTVPHIRVPAMQEIHAGQAQNTAIVLSPNDVVTEAGIHLAVLAIPEEGEVCVDMQQEDNCAMVVETSGVDGEPGEEEVVGENLETSAAYICKVCKEGFEGTEELIKHLKTHLVDTPFRCGLCTYATVSRTQLDSHMQLTHKTKLMPQANEEEHTVTAEDETAADSVGQKEAPPADSTVPESVPDEPASAELTEEPESASTSEPVSSATDEAAMTDMQKKSSEATTALQQLIALRGPDKTVVTGQPGVHGYKALHKCPVCSRSFRGSTYLRLHLRTHTGERPHKCSSCGKTFTTKDTLNKHLTVHSTERQYKCGECGKLFKRISHVREHLKVHSNDRPYACNMCNKTFKTVNACKVHMRTHTDALPYECTFCPKVFRERGSLERHLRTHTGEKPYQCTYCGRSFAEHGTLSRHLKAKAPCSAAVQLGRMTPEGETQLAAMDEDVQPQQKHTILTEFSSVVTDTQQYIIHTDHMGNVVQAPEEFVMVDSNGDSIQNVEVVTVGNGVSDVVTQDSTGEYVIVNNANISLFDPNTGQPINMDNVTLVAPSGVAVNEEATQAVAMIPTDGDNVEPVETVLMAVPNEHDEVISMAMQDGSGDIQVIAMVPESEHIDGFVTVNGEDDIDITPKQEGQIEHEQMQE